MPFRRTAQHGSEPTHGFWREAGSLHRFPLGVRRPIDAETNRHVRYPRGHLPHGHENLRDCDHVRIVADGKPERVFVQRVVHGRGGGACGDGLQHRDGRIDPNPARPVDSRRAGCGIQREWRRVLDGFPRVHDWHPIRRVPFREEGWLCIQRLVYGSFGRDAGDGREHRDDGLDPDAFRPVDARATGCEIQPGRGDLRCRNRHLYGRIGLWHFADADSRRVCFRWMVL